MLKAQYSKYILDFKSPARTSRETMNHKKTYFIKVFDEVDPTTFGIGECALFEGLSCDDVPDYEKVLADTCMRINDPDFECLRKFPSILFGVETAIMDLKHGAKRTPFPSPWSKGRGEITINGLVWMGSIEEMRERIKEKIEAGFRCLKFKIGGEDFDQEFGLLREVRKSFPVSDLEIRLDANGAFTPENALGRLDVLSGLQVHSIEQPIKAGQMMEMAEICRRSPIPVALDEELIGHSEAEDKYRLLETIKPQYIILKPALCGGFSGAMEWISIAELQSIGWWVTSALESNIGLNAIAQWVSTLDTSIPQGLGTGALYLNNIPSPLVQKNDYLTYDPARDWAIPEMTWR